MGHKVRYWSGSSATEVCSLDFVTAPHACSLTEGWSGPCEIEPIGLSKRSVSLEVPR